MQIFWLHRTQVLTFAGGLAAHTSIVALHEGRSTVRLKTSERDEVLFRAL